MKDQLSQQAEPINRIVPQLQETMYGEVDLIRFQCRNIQQRLSQISSLISRRLLQEHLPVFDFVPAAKTRKKWRKNSIQKTGRIYTG